jgi:hypothetical protein
MNQKPINSPSKHRVSRIVLCVRRILALVDTSQGYAQFIADERQWGYEPDAGDEAEDFSDERVEAAEDKQAAKNRGTDITAT